MFKVRTFCLALLIPLLLVFFTGHRNCEDSSPRITQACEVEQQEFRELEERSEEGEEEFFFGGVLAASLPHLDCRDFHALEPATVRVFLLPTRSFGWTMPLRI